MTVRPSPAAGRDGGVSTGRVAYRFMGQTALGFSGSGNCRRVHGLSTISLKAPYGRASAIALHLLFFIV